MPLPYIYIIKKLDFILVAFVGCELVVHFEVSIGGYSRCEKLARFDREKSFCGVEVSVAVSSHVSQSKLTSFFSKVSVRIISTGLLYSCVR